MGLEPLTIDIWPRIRVLERENPARRRRISRTGARTPIAFRSFARMASTAAAEDVKKQSTARRDKLLEIERAIQARWEESKVFEVDAGDASAQTQEKFFGNFPYPYMNGALHLGHAFSLSKLEFMSGFMRMQGKKVLLPMGFHCTGMPIKAAADKLVRESEKFGLPPVFPADESEPENLPPPQESAPEISGEVKFKAKKSKAVAKTGPAKYQWSIMRSLGLEDDEIARFRDPLHWLAYFPPIARDDLKLFGLGCDWRRSFITTEANPYYDSFVRWQFLHLRERGKVEKNLRYAVYSPLDRQPCADHDRASGEGVQPQEYVLIKMELRPPFTGKLSALAGRKVYLAAATLRPETMYGQTNAWVLAEGLYGAYEVNEEGDVFVVTPRAALNLAYQRLSRVWEKPSCLLELTGEDLIGLPLTSPLAFNEVIRVLPMMNVKTDKGTGVVTSVPSDSPDDYMALLDLKNKPGLRAKYGVLDEWVLPYEVIPIIEIPEFGSKSAEEVCLRMKIKSQNDREALEEAKKMTYLKGFTEGRMLVGEFAGMRVSEAKPLIRKKLVDSGEGVIYSEPEKRVVSRSGDECVVALTDQWYLEYGEESWKELAGKCLGKMELYHEETRHLFEHTLGWLNQWACSRSFGLGTNFPWDPDFLIESLSDSTIYMAFYTVAHILQEGDLYGTSSEHPVKPEEMTRGVWDYIFGLGEMPETGIPRDTLERMRGEFNYWYPYDLRVSGKDLIQNHLTFSVYNHVAMFPEEKWPRAFRCNGFLLLNGEKMSKSSGNFLTLREAIGEFSADATRFALADAGDSVDDANFVKLTANSAILRLTKEMAWIKEEVLASEATLRTGPPESFADRVFENEINSAIKLTEQNFSSMMFREALKSGFYDLQIARDEYRLACAMNGMNRGLVLRFVDVQTKLITPFCPHYAEYVRSGLLGLEGFAVSARWPEGGFVDAALQRANKFLQGIMVDFRKALQKHLSGPKRKGNAAGGNAAHAANAATGVVGLVYIAEKYEGWKECCLKVLHESYDVKSKRFVRGDDEIAKRIAEDLFGGNLKAAQKQCMGFVRFKKDEAGAVGEAALEVKLPFGEREVLEENGEMIARMIGVERVVILSSSVPEEVARAGKNGAGLVKSPPSPGNPVIVFVSVGDVVADVAADGVARVNVS